MELIFTQVHAWTCLLSSFSSPGSPPSLFFFPPFPFATSPSFSSLPLTSLPPFPLSLLFSLLPSHFSSLSPPSLLPFPFLLLSSYASDDYLHHQMVRRKESLQRTLSTADSRTSTLVNSLPVSGNTTPQTHCTCMLTLQYLLCGVAGNLLHVCEDFPTGCCTQVQCLAIVYTKQPMRC